MGDYMPWRNSIVVLGIALLVLGVGACVPVPTPSPTPTPTPPSEIPAVQVTPLPHALKDVTATQVYKFRVNPAQTTVEYAVHEVLLGNNQITRGKTNVVEGEFQLYMQNGKVYVTLSNLEVDLRTLKTDNELRDQAIRSQWLESDKFPKAIFVAKTMEGLPGDAEQGQDYSFKVIGDLTIRNTTRPVTFDVTVRIQNNAVIGEGTATIFMKDFGFDPPNIVGQTIVSDPVTVTIKGVADLIGG